MQACELWSCRRRSRKELNTFFYHTCLRLSAFRLLCGRLWCFSCIVNSIQFSQAFGLKYITILPHLHDIVFTGLSEDREPKYLPKYLNLVKADKGSTINYLGVGPWCRMRGASFKGPEMFGHFDTKYYGCKHDGSSFWVPCTPGPDFNYLLDLLERDVGLWSMILTLDA